MAEQQQTTSAALADNLKEFLQAFRDREGNFRYFDRINNMMASGAQSLVVDYIDFDSYSPDLAKQLTHKPDEMLEAFNEAALAILREIHHDYEQEIHDRIKVRIGNYTVQKGLRDINAELIDKLVSVSGMVVRSSEVKPLAKKVAYKCTNCNAVTEATLKGLVLKKPSKCNACGEKELDMDPENSIFIDFQMVRLQELPEDLPAGQLPHYVEVTVMGDLVDQCRPGDRIMLTGIIRIEQEQAAPQSKTSLFRLRMEGNNIEYLGGRAGSKDTRTVERIAISTEDERQIQAIGSKPDAYEKLVASFAPHIYGQEVIKESILLLIVGSVTKKLEDGSTRRGDINVLLVGDPGCLRGSSKVVLADGSMVDLASLGANHLDKIDVRMQNDEGDDVATVFHKYKKQKVIEIITDTGKSIVGTYNHPLLTRKGWKRLDEMQAGDELKVATHIPCSITNYVPTRLKTVTRAEYVGKVPEFLDEELAAFMGFLTGDGWSRMKGYKFGFIVSQKEEDTLLQPLLTMSQNLFGIEPRLTRKGDPGQIVVMGNGRQAVRTMYTINVEYDFRNVVEMLSFIEGSTKRAPALILQSKNSVVSSYLKWLFEANGTVFNKGRARRAILLKSIHVELLRDVQLLLLRFGIHARIIQHQTGNNLVIRSGPSIIKYSKHIGFASAAKSAKLADLVWWALEFRRNKVHDEEYEKIVRVIFHEEPEDVYDVEIPASHKFIANGIVSHNTAKSEMLKFAAKIAPRGLYTSGRGSTAAGLTAAVIRDKSGIMMLEAGAVVLGDQGLVCMTENTEIYTGYALVPIGQLWDKVKSQTYITKSGREAKQELIPVGIYDSKIRADIEGSAFAIMRKRYAGEIVRLTFASGLTLEVTPEHLLRRTTNVKNLWIKAGDIKAGDVLRAPVRIFKPAYTLDVTPEQAYVVGCAYGDGSFTAHSIAISQSNVNFDIIRNIQKNLPGVFVLYDKGDRVGTLGKYVLVSRMFHLRITDNSFLRRTRFLIKSPSIDNILLLNDSSLWSFIAGVFDTNGEFSHEHGKVYSARMQPTTSDHELRVMLYSLRRLGVYARVLRTKKGLPIIQITGQDLRRFTEGIMPFSAKAQHENTSDIVTPKNIERGTEKVVKTERVPYDGYVYDLSVGKYHNYEASLVYIHNCIDEFDKIKAEDRSALHEVMEQQTCSVAKGGIVATLNARTSILSAANPMYGKYDPYKNITENVNLPVPLLTRFDLIFIVRDIPEKDKDNLIASHILEIHKDVAHAAKPAIDIDLFSKYLTYAKRLEPSLTSEAIDIIRGYYMDMRKAESEGMITVTPRQLEGLVRLATARARILLKDKVDADDAKRAIYLVDQMLKTAGVDVNTGKMDVGVLYGKPQSEVSKQKLFMEVFNGISGPDNNEVEDKNLVAELVKTGRFDEEEARSQISKFNREGRIYERRPGFWAKA
ncbi:MAG TPA: LAGLIDADG family homing endonuclease [Nitrososphaera sp.]|nr:LAGLIDADG family homing endonuclease [Nitrososphaera sp.]